MSSDRTIDLASQRPERDAGVPHFQVACIRCGGAVRPGRLRCAQCSEHEQVGQRANVSSPTGARLRIPLDHEARANQFSIESILLVTTLVAICLGLVAAVPPLGVGVSLLAVGALIRTIIAARQTLRVGIPFPAGEKIQTFILSLSIVVIALGISAMVLLCLSSVAWMAFHVLWDVVPPRSAAERMAYFTLGTLFWISVLVAPLTAGSWFLWATRPQ